MRQPEPHRQLAHPSTAQAAHATSRSTARHTPTNPMSSARCVGLWLPGTLILTAPNEHPAPACEVAAAFCPSTGAVGSSLARPYIPAEHTCIGEASRDLKRVRLGGWQQARG